MATIIKTVTVEAEIDVEPKDFSLGDLLHDLLRRGIPIELLEPIKKWNSGRMNMMDLIAIREKL